MSKIYFIFYLNLDKFVYIDFFIYVLDFYKGNDY